MITISDLSGSGGAERLFSYFHEYMRARRPASRMTLITATSSLARLRAAGRLSSADGVIALRLGDSPGRGKFSIVWMTWRLLLTTLSRRFDLVHICLPSPIYLPFAAVLTALPKAIRPKVSLTVVDCTLAHSLEHEPMQDTYEHQVLDAHRWYARWARLDAIYSWYQAFVDVATRRREIAGAALLRAARYCFTEPRRFSPARKEKLIVFAGRLSHQKRPLLFVDTVAELRRSHARLIEGWRFGMYGRGVLEPEVRARIVEAGLQDIVLLDHASDMSPVFARSQVFVSTQAFENFTSLAMLEAMAAGNAVIAEDVGQTREFVRDGVNGFVAKDASPAAFADAVGRWLRSPELHGTMAAASRMVATEIHTIDHFADDITAFWADVVRAS